MSKGGITTPNLSLPAIPAVTSGGVNYENRMAATQSLSAVANGNLSGGGGKRRYRNNVKKVMKGCNSKKTRRHNKKKRHGKRIFRGGNNITPAVTDGKIQLTMPSGSSDFQTDSLKSLTGGLLDAQTANANLPPVAKPVAVSNFSGGGVSRRRHRNTKYRRLRYKKSIGRKSRSYRRRSGRR